MLLESETLRGHVQGTRQQVAGCEGATWRTLKSSCQRMSTGAGPVVGTSVSGPADAGYILRMTSFKAGA